MRRPPKSVALLLPFAVAAVVLAAALGSLGPSATVRAQDAGLSPCVPEFEKWVSPSTVNLGESVTITLRLRAACPAEPVTRHIVLVLDATGSMTGTPRNALIAGAREFVRGLDLAREPGTRVALVAFADTARTLTPLTNDESRLLDDIGRIGAEGGTRIDLGIMEGLRALVQGRRGMAAPLFEAMVLFSDGGNNSGCDAVRQAAGAVKAQGILLATVCLGRQCDEHCMRLAASDPDNAYFRAEDPAWLGRVFERVRMRIVETSVRRVTVNETLADTMLFVPGSADPEPSAPDNPDQWLRWESNWLPADGVTYTFAVLPLTSGNLAVDLDASGELVDGRGRTRLWDFPVSYVTVVDPWATPAPPAPSRCLGSLDVSVDPASVTVGEAVTVTHRLDVGCPALPMDLVLVLDGSSGMAGEPHERMKAAAGALVASLGLPGIGGDVRVGVVEFNSAATALAQLTTDPVAVQAAIARVGATDGARLDVGFSEATRMLREGRPSAPNAGRDLVKAIVVMSKGDRGPACAEIPAAHEAKGEGVLVLTVADDPADVCLDEAATSGRHALHAADVDALVQAVSALRERNPRIVVSELEISGRLSPYFDYVPDSAAPPLDSGPADLPAFRWRSADVGAGTASWSLQLRPVRYGVPQVYDVLTLYAADWQGGVRQDAAIVLPHVWVDDPQGPTPSPTHGTPQPTSLYLPLALRQHACEACTVPLDLALVIDTSPSMAEPSAPGGPAKLQVAGEAARHVLGDLDLAIDRAAVVTCGDVPDVAQSLTGDRELLDRAIAGVAITLGAQLDRGLRAARRELAGSRARQDAIPVLVVLTDGRVDAPEEAIAEAVAAKAAGIEVIVLVTGDDADAAVLARVASRPDWVLSGPDRVVSLVRRVIPCP